MIQICAKSLGVLIVDPTVRPAVAPKQGIMLYEGTNYAGKSYHFTTSKDLNNGYPGDKIKSAKVFTGHWVLNEHPGFTGKGMYLQTGKNYPRLVSFTTSSMRKLPDTGISLFENIWYDGKMYHFTTTRGLNNGYPNDKLKSAVVVTDRWILYDHLYEGPSLALGPGGHPRLKSFGTSSIQKFGDKAPKPSQTPTPNRGIVLYERENYGGKSYHFTNSKDLHEGYPGDKIKSAQVLSDKWILNDDPKFKGRGIFLKPGNYPRLASYLSSSLRKIPDTGIILLEDVNLAARMWHYTNSVDLHQGYPGDRVKSAVVCSDKWALFDDPRFKGKVYTLSVGAHRRLRSFLSSSMMKLRPGQNPPRQPSPSPSRR